MTRSPGSVEDKRRPARRRVVFVLLDDVHVLDLSGAAQVFYEAGQLGGSYEVRFCGPHPRALTAQGLVLADLEPLPEVGPGDHVVVPGISSDRLEPMRDVPIGWLRAADESGATISSICTGAFALGRAGLLSGRRCTTHWKVLDRLARLCPDSEVLDNRLFVRDGRIVSSAGVASGIDMSLALVEEDHGPLVAGRVAREIVVYLRRDGRSGQTSIYLDYRAHVHPAVHRVQDWMVHHPERRRTIGELASIAAMSPRNLTRVFKQTTGITIKEFDRRLKLEIAGSLLRSPDYTVETVALRCGFRDARQLRRLWQETYATTPREWRHDPSAFEV